MGTTAPYARGATPEGGFRIFEVWESRDHFDRFVEERLMPILREMGGGGNQPNVTSYSLHEYVVIVTAKPRSEPERRAVS